ncbi:hypothetical protein HR12_39485 [Microbacterium sp. SUBG005]|nr:hypothetical protein HR12_39485 [Microbacterium sp. SUBG005]
MIMQVATFKPDVELAKTLPPALYGPDEAIAADFFRRLDFSDTRTINVVRGQLTPVIDLALRAIIRPRSVQVLDRIGNLRGLKAEQVAGWLGRLSANEERLRDHRTEVLLSEWA